MEKQPNQQPQQSPKQAGSSGHRQARRKKRLVTPAYCSQILYGRQTPSSLDANKLRVIAFRAFEVAAHYIGVSLNEQPDYVAKRIEELIGEFGQVNELTLEPLIDGRRRKSQNTAELWKLLGFAREVRMHIGGDAPEHVALSAALAKMHQDAKSRISRSRVARKSCSEWKDDVAKEAVRLKKCNKALTVSDMARKIAANPTINHTAKRVESIRKVLNQFIF